MFQNLNETERTKDETGNTKNILTNIISKKYIILYIITLMISFINVGYDMSPFSIAIIGASISNEIPIIAIILLSIIGNGIKTGINGILSLIISLLIFFAGIFIKEPKYNESIKNEKIKLSYRIFFSVLIVNVVKLFINQFLIYDLLMGITSAIMAVIFYKIFVNSLTVIINYNEKMAFSMEEILGTSLLISISLCAFGNLSIWEFSIKNVLSIFIVLVLGWKNGVLVGTTAGATIGVTLGIITGSEPIAIAAYTLSGMISGILNKFGKIGVICGFILGNVILSYVANGLINNLILFKEILIAGIALLAVPKNVNLSIESMVGKDKFLPAESNRKLNKSKDTVNKLNNISTAVKEMANTYKDVAATIIDEEDIFEKNKQTFISELLNNIEHMENNILYDNIENTDGEIVDQIFKFLQVKGFIKEGDLIKILAKNNNYVVNLDDDKEFDRDVEKMTEAINLAYRISKMNFIWNERLKEEKKNFESQLNGVSKAISNIADNIDKQTDNSENYAEKKEQIILLLKHKNIIVDNITINKEKNERYEIELYTQIEYIKDAEITIINILSKTLKEKLIIKEQKEIESENIIKYLIISDDKYLLEIGQAKATKDGMAVSGDIILQTKLKDGKYLIAISDGMGSGPEARKSSQIVTSLLKRLMDSGFERNTSVDLINSSLLSVSNEVFATLDLLIADLYNGNLEFIKNGACPTYIKGRRRIQIIKSLTLPTGVVKEANTDVFDRDIESNDIVVMLSDGILDSNVEYKNKELWMKYLLEDIEISNPQKMADIILNESIDNNFGKVKDDMSVVVCKFINK